MSRCTTWVVSALRFSTRMREAYSAASSRFSRKPSICWKPKPRMGISIFDWPLHTQTSPSIKSETVRLSLPDLTVSVYGPPAAPVGRVTRQDPSSATLALTASCVQEAVTVTVLPGSPQPQTGAAVSRWSTA